MDIDESIDIIEDAIEEYNDSRAFILYVQCGDKEQYRSYESYKKAMIEEAKKQIEVVDIEELKARNRNILKDFMSGR